VLHADFGQLAHFGRGLSKLGVPLLAANLAACSSFLPAAGPLQSALKNDAAQHLADPPGTEPALPYVIVDLNAKTVAIAAATEAHPPPGSLRRLAGHLPSLPIGAGDILRFTIYEASAGGLFIPTGTTTPHGNSVEIPDQEVDRAGNITFPFAGTIHAAGRTPTQLATLIENRLKQRAIEPQVVVSFGGRRSTIVTVTGDVNKPGTVPLSQGGNRLLDVLSSVGGSKYSDFETLVTLQRGGRSATMRLDAIDSDPANNIYVMPHDVIVVKHDPQYYYVFGASGVAATSGYSRTAAFSFQHAHTDLAEVLATAGGLLDDRADPRWVVLYRLERRSTLEKYGVDVSAWHSDRIPTIYRVNLMDPSGFFLTQRFPITNNDLIYVSTAPYVNVSLIAGLLSSLSGSASNASLVQSR
jgi:polysaccharide export outer membrane protein